MEHEQGIDSFIEKRTNPPQEEKPAEESKQSVHEKVYAANEKRQDFQDKAKSWATKLKTPGAIVGMLGLIILIVFAIAPAYKDAPYSRLGLLMRVILTGGTIKDKEDSTGVQAVTGGVYANGQEGGDLYAPINVWGSGAYGGGH